jgi:hypothetical protein
VRQRSLSRLLLALGMVGVAALTASSASGAAKPAGNRYATYTAPAGKAVHAGEVSIGVDWKTGGVLFQAGFETDKVTFPAIGDPTWSDVTSGTTGLLTLDPIAASDNSTGRVFVSQLVGAGSLMAYTDDDGTSWSTSQGSGEPAGYDHQTVGAGPYPPEGITPGSYPHAVYYCSQANLTALCARSDNGGTTFGVGIPAYTFEDCIGLHGHVRVAPDGSVWLPNRSCGGAQGVAVSLDAGQSFTLHPVPGSRAGTNGDPSVSTGRDGTTYFAYSDGNGPAKVSLTRDHAKTWSEPFDLGAQVGVVNSAFIDVIAGDGDKAAVAFLGTKTPGNSQDEFFGQDASHTRYVGADYHLYIATTYDRGQTWSTVDTTPNDPVQRGRICLAGTTCTGSDRNLLDFMDIQVDRAGHVLVGYADGCINACVTSALVATNGHTAQGSITRQVAGKGLYARTPPVTS